MAERLPIMVFLAVCGLLAHDARSKLCFVLAEQLVAAMISVAAVFLLGLR